MLTFTGSRNLFAQLTNNSNASNLTFGDTLINQYTLELVHKFASYLTETQITLQTLPGQAFYSVGTKLRKIGTVMVNVGGTNSTNLTSTGFNWQPVECPNRQYWNKLNLVQNITSDVPQFFYYFDGQIGLYPKPSAGYNPIYITGQLEATPLEVADYTTGTLTSSSYSITFTTSLAIGAVLGTLTAPFSFPTGSYLILFSNGETILCSFTNGSTAVTWTQALIKAESATATLRTSNNGDILTGVSTVWTSSMNSFVLQPDKTTGGDNFWYKIDTVYDTTHLALTSPYNGTAFSSATVNYLIGQVSLIPQAYQMIPIYRACVTYFTVVSKDESRAGMFAKLADGLEETMKDDVGNKNTNPVCDETDDNIINPNLYVNSTSLPPQ